MTANQIDPIAVDYITALVSGDQERIGTLAVGAARRLAEGLPGLPPSTLAPEVSIGSIDVMGDLATVAANVTVPLTDLADRATVLFLQLKLVRADGLWRVHTAEISDPSPGARWVPLSSAERETIRDTIQTFVQLSTAGDLTLASSFLGGRAWISGETLRRTLAGKPLVEGQPDGLVVTVLDWAPPTATVRVQYEIDGARRVEWLASLYRPKGRNGHAPTWFIVRIDPLH